MTGNVFHLRSCVLNGTGRISKKIPKASESESVAMTIHALGPFRLDTRSDLLLLGNEPVALGRRAVVLLRVLVEQRGSLVLKDTLIEAAWPGQSVEESNLTVQIAALRRALGAVPGGDRWVETRPRRGYRFVGPAVTEKQANAPASEPRVGAAPDAVPMTGDHAAEVAATDGSGLTLPDRPSLAVLPFLNISGDPEQEYFADGMAEDITTELSRFRELFVISRTSTFTYKGKAVDVRQIARELGVRYVVEGSVRKRPNNVRVTAQLIDAISGAHLWAERYDRASGDIFAMEDEITASIAAAIEPTLARAERRRVLRKPPDRLDAWEAYQRGLWHFYKYGAEDNQIAQTFFRQAIALDPNFAPGHYGYALALYWDSWLYSTRPFDALERIELSEARLAVSLDDKDATAHAALALVMCTADEWEESVVEARAALALNPNGAFVMTIVGLVLGRAGYHQEAIRLLRQGMRASPHDPLTWQWLNRIGDLQLFSGEFEAALETYRQVIRLRPQFFAPHLSTAAALAYLGRSREAREAFERARAQFAEQIERRRHRPPWARPEDWAIKTEGLRLAAAGPEALP
jgi:TolB-like protein